MNIPHPIRKLADHLADLPTIGPRQALRLTFYLLSQGRNELNELAKSIDELGKLKLCRNCFFVHQNQNDLCDICGDKNRRRDLIAIIEKETDLISIEKTHKFHGRYFILGPISKTGILEEWQKLRLQVLKAFIKNELSPLRAGASGEPASLAEEIILGFSPTSNGDFNSSILIKELSPFAKKITRLGRGLPTGGEIEFADDETLGEALAKRS